MVEESLGTDGFLLPMRPAGRFFVHYTAKSAEKQGTGGRKCRNEELIKFGAAGLVG